MIYNYSETMEEVIIECKNFTKFHVKKKKGIQIKNIINMCQDYGLEVKVY
jgi:hypothetical protein